MKNTARLSRCRRYRYALWRTWNDELPRVLFIGLNPSIADERSDDPTLVRCMNFARDWGYGGVITANLFAWRAADPREMRLAADPIGPRNNHWLRRLAGEAGLIVAAWGNDGGFMNRSSDVLALLPPVHCLKINSGGQPAHPLYQPARAKPQPYSHGL